MNKTELIKEVLISHNHFVDYINSLTDEEFKARFKEKWNAGMELNHIVKSVEPLAKILGNKATILKSFGKLNRPILSYIDLTLKYKNELKKGGVASGKFVPKKVTGVSQKANLINSLLDSIKVIENHLVNFTEYELDTLVLPHPLLGKLTIREMIYFTIYHAKHHEKNIKRNIEEITNVENVSTSKE